jgi:hypothetical protein
MNWPILAMTAAGVIGVFVPVAHGVLMQKRMVGPLEKLAFAASEIPNSTARFLGPLLHFTTFGWFIGGFALIVSANWLGTEARIAIGLLVGSQYLYGAICNFRASRGRHPGWMLMAVAVALIVVDLRATSTTVATGWHTAAHDPDVDVSAKH